ncbi:hypothetical protein [Arthrobacter sp. HY1533]|uniref:hypothetical protein n=1 Tax=Arthrobacter sp. HY1533 TaxID=2970919 RepID=UPI0022B9E54F|nr:hypothetical protein [Arthrobacter sp. HY1533]
MSANGTEPHPAAKAAALPLTGLPAIGTGPKVARKSVATTMAAVTLAAAAVLGAPGLVGGSAPTLDPASIIASPPNSTEQRIAGVHEDMARAVALQQVTAEQAAFLERQLVRRIQGGTADA